MKKKIDIIRGAYGPSAAERERAALIASTIRSTAYANIVDLVSEGEIQGFAGNSLEESIFLDGTPIKNADGSYNFPGVTVDHREGTQSQTYIAGFGEVQDDVFVNTKVTFASPVTRTISNANLDAVTVKITTPVFTLTDSGSGSIGGNALKYQIQLQSNGGGFVTVVDTELLGKSTSQYQRSHRIELTGSAPWDVRLVQNQADATSPFDQRLLYFDSYTEIIDAKLSYPNSAIFSLKVDASKFSNIPTRAFDIKGLKIKIPDNATVNTDGSLTYSGAWSGNFTTAWCSNPAWVFYDLITTDRYGLGKFIPDAQVDKWALYTIGVYCDTKVDNGSGGTEPRFSCNLYLQTQASAYKVLQDLASVFRGLVYWSNGSVTATQDAPSDPVYLYTQANVIDGNFNYSGASKRARHTVALITWNDPQDFYRPKVQYVEDQSAIADFGIFTTQVTAIGCTSQGQADRIGKWILYSEQNESEIVAFKTGIEGSVARPGQIVNIADANRAGVRLAGRVSSATTTTVTVDSDPDGSHIGATLYVLLSNGTVENKTITAQSGRVYTLSSALSSAPHAQSIWMISSATISVQTFRILSVTQSSARATEVDITAIKYDSGKYASVEDGAQLEKRNYTSFTAVPESPQVLLITENLFNSITGVRNKVTFSWNAVQSIQSYEVRYQQDNNNFVSMPEVQQNEIEIFDITPGTYTFQVSSINSIGKRSPPSSITQAVYGKLAPPTNVLNFSMLPTTGSTALLTWTQATDLDVLVGGSVKLRHTPRTTGQTWASSIDIVDFVAGSDTFAYAPLMAGTYLAKFVDSTGNESVTESIIVTTIPIPSALNVVATSSETGSFSGTKVNTSYDSTLGGLTLVTADALGSSILWDSLGLIDSLTRIDYLGQVVAAGSYYFASAVDLGAVFTSNLTATIQTLAFAIDSFWDDLTTLVDSLTDIDGSNLSLVNAKLYLRTTLDDPSSISSTWDVWKPFFTGSYLARGYQFRLDLTSDSTTENICVQTCAVTIDMPDRVEEFHAVASGVGAFYSVTFAHAFNAVPAIGITTHDLQTGDYYAITSKTVSGFNIVFKNSAGTIVSRTFDVLIKGYGLN